MGRKGNEVMRQPVRLWAGRVQGGRGGSGGSLIVGVKERTLDVRREEHVEASSQRGSPTRKGAGTWEVAGGDGGVWIIPQGNQGK